MAHYTKFNKAACGHMFAHYERAKDEDGNYIKFSNQEIDTSKSHLNYNLVPDHQDGQGAFVKRRCGEVKMQNRADVNVMCSWIVTAPKEIKEDETEKFFRETYKFLSKRYGKENIVSAHVHMDETTPHIHFAFVPVVMCKKKNILKVSAKERVDRLELRVFHDDLSEHMEKLFGRDVGILNEATKEGNKTVKELKQGTAQKKLAEIKKAVQVEEKNLSVLKNKKKSLENEMVEMERAYKGKKLTLQDINEINPTKDVIGGIRNITLDDVENLKKMAVGSARKESALQRSNDEVKRLRKENATLKKQIPTVAQTLEHNTRLTTIQDLEKDVDRLEGILSRIISGINQFPEQVQEFVRNIIDAPGSGSRSRTRADGER